MNNDSKTPKHFQLPLPPHVVTNYFMAATEKNLYLNLLLKDQENLFIYGNDWNSNYNFPTCLNTIKHQATKWNVKEDGLFSFAVNETHTFLTKLQPNGKYVSWNKTLPMCVGSSNFLIASCYPNTYALCSPQNIIMNFDSQTVGKIINFFSVDEGNIQAIECSPTHIFVLYDDSRVVQYSKNSDYVYTYLLSGKKTLPNYNKLKVSNDYILYALCNDSPDTDKCTNSTIFKWRIVENTPKTKLIEKSAQSPYSDYDYELNRPAFKINTVTFTNIKIDFLPKQNSYFSAVSHQTDKSTIISYFSGSGNVQRSTVGDRFITQIVIPNSNIEVMRPVSVNYIPVKHPNTVLSRYASALFESDGRNFLVLHGGLSSDYINVSSKFFSFDLSDGHALTLNQQKQIP